jgi:hypothetical protein
MMVLGHLVLGVTLNDDDDNETRLYRLYTYECNETMSQSEQLTQPLQDLEGLEWPLKGKVCLQNCYTEYAWYK